MHWDFHFVVRIESLKRRCVIRVVDRVEPNLLRQRLFFDHRRVVGGADGSKSGRKGTDTLVSVNLQIEDSHHKRVARRRSLDEEWSCQWIIALSHGGRVAGLLNAVAETVQRIGLKNVSGAQTSDRRSNTEDVFDVVDRALVVHHWRAGVLVGLRHCLAIGGSDEREETRNHHASHKLSPHEESRECTTWRRRSQSSPERRHETNVAHSRDSVAFVAPAWYNARSGMAKIVFTSNAVGRALRGVARLRQSSPENLHEKYCL